MPASVLAAWAIRFFAGRGTFDKAMWWFDRMALVAAAGTLVAPFAVAQYYGIAVWRPLPLVAALGVALACARGVLPVKQAGVFVSFAVLFNAIDVVDTFRNEKSSPYREVYRILREERLAPGEIVFHPEGPGSGGAESGPGTGAYEAVVVRSWETVSFYWDRLLPRGGAWERITADPGVKAIVTHRQALKEEDLKGSGGEQFRPVELRKGLVLLLRSRATASPGRPQSRRSPDSR
jgi:hypothetical protein